MHEDPLHAGGVHVEPHVKSGDVPEKRRVLVSASPERLQFLFRQDQTLGHVQTHDGDVRAAAVEFIGGDGVAEDVRLGARVDVAVDEEGATEVDDLAEVLHHRVAVGAKGERDVRGGGEGDDGDLAGVRVGGLDDELGGGFALDHLSRGWGLIGVSESVVAVDKVRDALLLLAHDRGVMALVHGDVRASELFEDVQRVLRRHLRANVAEQGRDAHHLHLGAAQREQDGEGIVHAGVGVDDDLQRRPRHGVASDERRRRPRFEWGCDREARAGSRG